MGVGGVAHQNEVWNETRKIKLRGEEIVEWEDGRLPSSRQKEEEEIKQGKYGGWKAPDTLQLLDLWTNP